MLFVDLIGFTTLSAQLSSVKVIELLRECLAFFEEAVFAHQGTLDKYLGDGLMATFGTPRVRGPGRHQCPGLRPADGGEDRRLERRAPRRGPAAAACRHRAASRRGGAGRYRRRAPPGVRCLGDTVNVARRSRR
jgi:Adenylate cyclase, family 3 (some proteins contain HAMP domain)